MLIYECNINICCISTIVALLLMFVSKYHYIMLCKHLRMYYIRVYKQEGRLGVKGSLLVRVITPGSRQLS